MWTYPEHWAIENMATETAQGVKTFQTLLNKGVTPLNASVDLPVTLSSSIPRAALVGRAALTIFNVAGVGLTAYQLYNLFSDNGLASDGSIPGAPTTTGCAVYIPPACGGNGVATNFYPTCNYVEMANYVANCNGVSYTT